MTHIALAITTIALFPGVVNTQFFQAGLDAWLDAVLSYDEIEEELAQQL